MIVSATGDIQWTETGDRYMLKLFRDYVFHQVTPTGQPWIDLSHIVQCLNKVKLNNSILFYFSKRNLIKNLFSLTLVLMIKYVLYHQTVKT